MLTCAAAASPGVRGPDTPQSRADHARLEIVCTARYRGFESHSLREGTGGSKNVTSERRRTCAAAASPGFGAEGSRSPETIMHDWKSCVPQGTVGSNPTLSGKETV